MKNTIGSSVTLTLFGESHGEAIGAVLDGIAPGMEIDGEYIAEKMALRRSSSELSTPRTETDKVKILSGVVNGKTTGTPICILIDNENTKSLDYEKTEFIVRPGHADFTAECKYHGFEDRRGGGHFSGRLTAPIVAAGAIILKALEEKGIFIGSHISRLNGISDREFCDYSEDIKLLSKAEFPVLSNDKREEMRKRILSAKAEGDSVGGVLETAVIGLPKGLGEPFFDSVESLLAHALFSIPAVKGVEFGKGFSLADMMGSEANDPFCIENGEVVTKTNNAGGILGGITNGMPILFKVAIKPTPSIFKTQKSVDIKNMVETELNIKGRHDPAIVHRARAVVDAVTALTIADLLCTRYGTDYLGGK